MWPRKRLPRISFTALRRNSAADSALLSAHLGVRLRVIHASDLLHEKLRAGSDPARRRSKRLQNLADAQALVEEPPELMGELEEREREPLDSLPE